MRQTWKLPALTAGAMAEGVALEDEEEMNPTASEA